jgi:hypothetical protein
MKGSAHATSSMSVVLWNLRGRLAGGSRSRARCEMEQLGEDFFELCVWSDGEPIVREASRDPAALLERSARLREQLAGPGGGPRAGGAGRRRAGRRARRGTP